MKEPVLLTPGPLTTSTATKLAMVRDWGSRDTGFIEINRRVRELLLEVVAEETHVCVPLQGSGTFAVEAMLGTLVPKNGHVLVPQNGAYCKRIAADLRDSRPPRYHDRISKKTNPSSRRTSTPPWPRTRPSRTWRSCIARPAPAFESAGGDCGGRCPP